MPDKFEDLQINGAFIRELSLVPSESVRVSVIRAPGDKSERQVSVISDLQFYEVQSCHCNFKANPWLEIKTHTTLMGSELLSAHLRNKGGTVSGAEAKHYQIICDEGEINIVARRFTILVAEEIPHRGPSEE